MAGSKCEFCSITSGDAEAAIVFQNADVTAFMDRRPFNPGHILVIPNSHEPDFEELNSEVFGRLMLVVQELSRVVKQVYSPKKVGLAVAGFDVPHAHVHIIPLHDYHDLTSKRLLEGTLEAATREDLGANARKIRDALRAQGSGAV